MRAEKLMRRVAARAEVESPLVARVYKKFAARVLRLMSLGYSPGVGRLGRLYPDGRSRRTYYAMRSGGHREARTAAARAVPKFSTARKWNGERWI